MNFFGVPAPFASFIANSEEEMLELVAGAKTKGALISANHPKDPGCPYLWESTSCFDTVEVWNAPMRKSNMDAIAWWHNLLLEGKKIPLIGGSDYHRDWHPALFAHPVTRVYARSSSYQDILEAIKSGHAYVAATKRSAELSLTCTNNKNETVMMGDSVNWSNSLTLTVTAKNLGTGMVLQLVTAEGVVHTWRKNQIPAHVNVMLSWRFAYLIVRRQISWFSRVAAISNPIYFF